MLYVLLRVFINSALLNCLTLITAVNSGCFVAATGNKLLRQIHPKVNPESEILLNYTTECSTRQYILGLLMGCFIPKYSLILHLTYICFLFDASLISIQALKLIQLTVTWHWLCKKWTGLQLPEPWILSHFATLVFHAPQPQTQKIRWCTQRQEQ